jgi:molybdate transport system ATP-binding protein
MMLHSNKTKQPMAVGVTLQACQLTLAGQPVLRQLSWHIAPGSFWVVRGANGAGKTQLLRLLCGERWPDPTPAGRQARTYVLGETPAYPLSRLRSRLLWVGGEAIDRYERYQWNFSVQRVVASGVDNSARPLRRLTPAEAKTVRQVLRDFGLWELRRRALLQLSFGQRRWVLLARAYLSQCGLIALDEIFNGLDEIRRAALLRLLPKWQARGVTLVMALHSQDTDPVSGARTLWLAHGRRATRARVLPSRQARAKPTATARKHPQATESPLLKLCNASIFRDYKPVIANLNLTVRSGEHWLIVGANGSGKSTLLEAILGNVPIAFGGSIERGGLKPNQPLRQWQARVGYVSPMLQAENFFGASVLEVLLSGLRGSTFIAKPVSARERRLARACLTAVGLEVALTQAQMQLSYGQRRLLLLARALIVKPKLLLLDEPFTGLDHQHRQLLRMRLEQLTHTSMSLIMSVHHPKETIAGMTHCLDINTVSRAPQLGPVNF